MGLNASLQASVGALQLDVALEVRGAPLVLAGPNGSGKSTLLKLLLGALRPSAGRVELEARVLFNAQTAVDVPVEDRAFGYVPQSVALFSHLTALENVAFAARARGPAASATEQAERMLHVVGAQQSASRRPGALSGGERQRVALARALASRPRALLLDEPFAAIDSQARGDLRAWLKAQAATMPVVLVTHDVEDAVALGGTLLLLEAGRVAQRGATSEVLSAPVTEFGRRFAAQRAQPTA